MTTEGKTEITSEDKTEITTEGKTEITTEGNNEKTTKTEDVSTTESTNTDVTTPMFKTTTFDNPKKTYPRHTIIWNPIITTPGKWNIIYIYIYVLLLLEWMLNTNKINSI